MRSGEGGAGGGRGGFGGGQGLSEEERRQRMEERLKSMTAEERAQWEERMRGRGGDPSAFGGGRGGRSGAQGTPAAARQATPPAPVGGFTTIDQLFGPLPTTESRGRAWLNLNGQLKAVQLRLGITDGTFTELISGELEAGQELVTSVALPALTNGNSGAARSPLMPGGRGPGGMPGGGGRGR